MSKGDCTFGAMSRVAAVFFLAITLIGCGVGEERTRFEEPVTITCPAAEILIQAPDTACRIPGLDTVPVWRWHDVIAEQFAKSECDDLAFTIPTGPIALWDEEIDGLSFLLLGDCDIVEYWPHRHFHLDMKRDGSVTLHKEPIAIGSIAGRFCHYQVEDAGLENSPYGWLGVFLSGSHFNADSLAYVQNGLARGIAMVLETRSQQLFGTSPCELPEASIRALAREHPVSIHIIPWEMVPKDGVPKNAQE